MLAVFAGAADAKKPGPVPQALVGTNPQTFYLTSNVALNAATYTDGPAVPLVAGTYLLTGQVLISAGTPGGVCQLTDGTTIIASGVSSGMLTLSGFVTEVGPATVKIACKAGGGNIIASTAAFNYPENGNTASSLTAFKTS